ncbi:glycoside hydrolase family 30 protein [Labilibaculum sp. K2S]|uniref:glycoside hydrolase family 30 protein n=1 Tax=Labilibaculum sp. K2S TaxID=3056386 RepID=UPI0025A4A265|nr:glycoside hydrolase family 30 protein [Labilibaculum sp. K2S]MDM8159530.1 glycoside hydrolase family 30 protein [Labilibaculum sp. K2S]
MKRFIPVIAIALTACSQPNKNEKNNFTKGFIAEGKTATVITTAKDTDLKLSQTGQFKFERTEQAKETENSIFVNPNNTFQTFIGIGGAITDASAEVFAKLSEEKQKKLITAYYGKEGNAYSLIRTSIHSCDFSSGSFTYIEEGDKNLETFSIEHDRQYRLPMIKQAIAKAGGSILFYASPWSPPAFMKDNKNMLQGGKLLPEYYDTWARYYAKFIKTYEKEGIPVWGITIQNEPMAVQRWESCIYTAEEERDFLKNHLGPILEQEGLGNKNIVVWDHNRDLITHRANTIFDDPEAAKYAWGTGFHWYETWRGGEPMFDNLQKIQEAYPDKKLLFTEGCNEAFDSLKYQYWPNAERYGRSMINDFNRGTVGWTDWNILLDETGGPNHVGNLCFSPIHADTRTDSLIYTPSYYYLGHFSKYIRPGAKRVSTVTSTSFLQSTSFINEDGKMATIVMNSTEKTMSYKLYIGANIATSIKIPARAIQTIIF